MARYQVNHSYSAYRDGTSLGPWVEGDVVELDDGDAEWVERDSPGALTPESSGAGGTGKAAGGRRSKAAGSAPDTGS